MKNILAIFFCLSVLFQQETTAQKIDRKTVVRRHTVYATQSVPNSPAQVGNGKFAFGMDMTGLQTFIPFNTLSDWSWHSFPLPAGMKPEDFEPFRKEVLLFFSQEDHIFCDSLKDALIRLMPEPAVIPGLKGGHLAMLLSRETYLSALEKFLTERNP